MKKQSLGLILLMSIASSASAKDLDARVRERAASMDGSAIEKAEGRIRRAGRTRGVEPKALRGLLRAPGLIQTEAQDDEAGALWQDDDDTSTRRTWRRLVRDQRGEHSSQLRHLEFYRTHKPTLTDESLVEKGRLVAAEVAKAEGLLGEGEELRPEHTVVQRFIGEDASGQTDQLVLSATVVLRRYVHGVAVLAEDGHVSVEFDAIDGSLVQLSYPTTKYEHVPASAAARKALQGTGGRRLQDRMRAVGFDQQVVRIGQKVRHNNVDASVKDYRCGFVELEGEKDLVPGCEVATASEVGGKLTRFAVE